MARIDPHSFTDGTHAKVIALDWKAFVDFDTHTIEATATLRFDRVATGTLDLDTRGLTIASVCTLDGEPVEFVLHPTVEILGERLELTLPSESRGVIVRYRTSPEASALQWLEAQQTAGGTQKFLFSQCQAIHARAVVPLQDTPQRRITFTAELTVPRELRGLMAAGFVRREEKEHTAVEHWAMPQAIAPYLFAFAVGELVAKKLGERTMVWAEPSVVDRAQWEFAGVNEMLAAGEKLFGEYPWERFDILVMPPSFPYGGMENPRLAFVTPTLLAGDRSQVRVIAHELAHSWTGNLVTNATAEHFWLNEGWTRYAELRIVEALEGPDAAALMAALCRIDLDETIARFTENGHPELTRLRTDLDGVDPDEAFSVVPYDKGYLLLLALERHVGRERFEGFAKNYLSHFAFGSVTTEDFVEFTERELQGALGAVGAVKYLDGEGVPSGAPSVRSARLDAITALGAALPSESFSLDATELNLFLDRLPRPQSPAFCESLDRRFGLGATGNMEVKLSWLRLAIASGYDKALSDVETVLTTVGRMKYLVPLYTDLLSRPETKPLAETLFARAQQGYHPIARAVVRNRFERT